MKLKLMASVLLLGSSAPLSANTISVNVSMPGAINPFTGYQMAYSDKDGSSCTFRFNQPGDGLSYLTSDRACPSFVTERRVFMDAQQSLEHMELVSTARTFAEFFGDDGYGNKVEKADFRYRCAAMDRIAITNPLEWTGIERNHLLGYVFMPISDSHIKGWYELDLSGYRTYKQKVGVWRLDKDGTITAVDRGKSFTIPEEQTSKCQSHRSH